MNFSKEIGLIAMILLKDTNPTWIVKWLRFCLAVIAFLAITYSTAWVLNGIMEMFK